MASTTLNTRIQLKYDTYKNWTDNNPTPLQGELCVVIVPASTGAVVQEPSVLFKVGDGTTPFNGLSFVSGIAADVYDWAKAASKPTYKATEIEELANYIDGRMVEDTDTQYKLEQDSTDTHILKLFSKGKNDEEWTEVTSITTADTVYDDTALAARVTAVEGLVGNTAVATQISEAIAALNLATTYATKDELAEAVAAAGADVDAVEAKIGTVEEGKTIVEMIEEAQEAATYDDTALADRVTTNEGKIATLVGEDADKSVRTIANEELAAQLIGENAKESLDTLEEIAAWIQSHPDDASAMNLAIQALQAQLVGIDAGEGTVKKYVDDAITALNVGQYALAADLTALAGRVATLEGASHTHENKEVLDGITEEKVAAWDAAEQNAKDYADEEIGKLAPVASSGDVKDLTQTEGDYVIFNCGSSSTMI